jgi:uncharacterized RDD family membrane protein YckC
LQPIIEAPPAGLLRRLAAAAYDLLLLAGIVMLSSFVLVIARGGEAVPRGSLAYQLLLLLQAAAFFTSFWASRGQTLGMRSWHIRLESGTGTPPSPSIALLRFGLALVSLAPLGLGFWWALLDPQKRTWHDRLTGTRVVGADS